MSIAHYTVPIPESATICPDWQSLCAEIRNWPDNWLDKKYGGYVVEDKGEIVLVCSDDLCAFVEQKDKEAMTITYHDPANLPSDVSIANYTVPIPENARIVSRIPSLRAANMERSHSSIAKKYGGFVIEEDGEIVIACDEKLSTELEKHPEQLQYIAEDVAEM